MSSSTPTTPPLHRWDISHFISSSINPSNLASESLHSTIARVARPGYFSYSSAFYPNASSPPFTPHQVLLDLLSDYSIQRIITLERSVLHDFITFIAFREGSHTLSTSSTHLPPPVILSNPTIDDEEQNVNTNRNQEALITQAITSYKLRREIMREQWDDEFNIQSDEKVYVHIYPYDEKLLPLTFCSPCFEEALVKVSRFDDDDNDDDDDESDGNSNDDKEEESQQTQITPTSHPLTYSILRELNNHPTRNQYLEKPLGPSTRPIKTTPASSLLDSFVSSFGHDSEKFESDRQSLLRNIIIDKYDDPSSPPTQPLSSTLQSSDWEPIVRCIRYATSSVAYNDYNLSLLLLELLSTLKCLSDPRCLRDLLIVTTEDYPSCNSHCPDYLDDIRSYGSHAERREAIIRQRANEVQLPSTHDCAKCKEYVRKVGSCIGKGCEVFTNEHFATIMAVVRIEIEEVSSSPSSSSASLSDLSSSNVLLNKKRSSLKRTQLLLTGFHSRPKHLLLHTIVNNVGSLSCNWVKTSASPYVNCFDKSWQMCLSTLIEIGVDLTTNCPIGDETASLCSAIVAGFVKAFSFLPHSPLSRFKEGDVYDVLPPVSNLASAVKNAISHVVDFRKELIKASKELPTDLETVNYIHNLHTKMIQLSKLMYAQDCINVASCLGYTQFLLYFNQPILVQDPLIWIHNLNYNTDSIINNRVWPDLCCRSIVDWEEHDYPVGWTQIDVDAVDNSYEMNVDINLVIAPFYDYSLLLFTREWNLPWTYKSHKSFSLPFREAIATMLKLGHKIGLPTELTRVVASYLNREWWAERRMCCEIDCYIKTAKQELTLVPGSSGSGSGSSSGSGKKKAVCPCARCGVASYCSFQCERRDYTGEHKRNCCSSPMNCTLSVCEIELCREISGGGGESDEEGGEARGGDGVNDDDDDEGDWSDIESSDSEGPGDGESNNSDDNVSLKRRPREVELISKFFTKSYEKAKRSVWEEDTDDNHDDDEEEEGGGAENV